MAIRGTRSLVVGVGVLTMSVLASRCFLDSIETDPTIADSTPDRNATPTSPITVLEGAPTFRDPTGATARSSSESAMESAVVEVLTLSGEPIPEAVVRLSAHGRMQVVGSTDRSGRIEVGLGPLLESERVVASHAAFASEEGFVPHQLDAKSVVSIRLSPKGSLGLRVVTSEGAGVSGVRVAAWPDGFSPGLNRLYLAAESSEPDPKVHFTRSDADGRCEILDVPAGRSFTVCAAGNGFASKTTVVARATDPREPSLIEPNLVSVVPIYGLVCSVVRRDGVELEWKAEEVGWRSGSTGGIDVFDDGLGIESFENPWALCLLGMRAEEVRCSNQPGGPFVRWLELPTVATLRGAITFNLPGCAERSEEFVVPRAADRLERRRFMLDPLPGITFGDLEITLRLDRRFARAATHAWSHLRLGSLLLQRIDGGDTERYAYPLFGILDAAQRIRGIPCGRYEAWNVLDFEDAALGSPRPKQVIEVTPAGASLEFDLSSFGSLEVMLLDHEDANSDYSGFAYAILSKPKSNVGGTYFSLGSPPFIAPLVPAGEYQIALRLDAPSRFGPSYTTLRFDERIVIVAGQVTRSELGLNGASK